VRLIQLYWARGHFPEAVNLSELVTIEKAGKDPSIVSNLRPLMLTSALYRAATKVLTTRMLRIARAERWISPEQGAYLPGREMMSLLVALQIATAQAAQFRKPLFVLGVDFARAFDTMTWPAILATAERYGISGPSLRLLKAAYTNVRAVIRANGGHTAALQLSVGIRQGCSMSAFLFILVINLVGSKARGAQGMAIARPRGGAGGAGGAAFAVTSIQYADDATLVAASAATLQADVNRAVADAEALKLQVNAGKTTLLVISHGDREIAAAASAELNATPVRVEGVTIEPAHTVRLLGLTLRTNWRWVDMVSDRAAATSRTVSGWYSLLRDSSLSTWTRRQVLVQYVNGVALFGAELWGGHPEKMYALLQAPLDKALALLIGLRGLPYHMTYRAALWELGLPPVHAIAGARKYRAIRVYADPDTICGQLRAAVKRLPQAPGCWTHVSSAAYRATIGADWETTPAAQIPDVVAAFVEREHWAWLLRTGSHTAARYVGSGWHASRDYVRLADRLHWRLDTPAVERLIRVRCQLERSTISLAAHQRGSKGRSAPAARQSTTNAKGLRPNEDWCPICGEMWPAEGAVCMASAPAAWLDAYGCWLAHIMKCEPQATRFAPQHAEYLTRAREAVALRHQASAGLGDALPNAPGAPREPADRLLHAAGLRWWAIAQVLLGGTLPRPALAPAPAPAPPTTAGRTSTQRDRGVAAIQAAIVVHEPDALQRRWLGTDPASEAAATAAAARHEPAPPPPFILVARYLRAWLQLLTWAAGVASEAPEGSEGDEDMAVLEVDAPGAGAGGSDGASDYADDTEDTDAL